MSNNVTVIIPLTGNKDIIKNIRKQITDKDELSFFHATSRNVEKLFNKTILSAKNNQILILSCTDPFVKDKKSKTLIKTFKSHDGILVTNYTESKIISKTSIKFDKRNGKPVEQGNNNPVDYIKSVLFYMNSDVIIPIDESIQKDKDKDQAALEEEQKIKFEEESPNNRKGVTVIDPPEKKLKKKSKKTKVKETGQFIEPESLKTQNEKPNILFICDVKGWAGWIKSNYIKKHLEPYYNIDIINTFGEGNKIHKSHYNSYDLCFTYGYYFISKIKRVDKNKRITGITAHRPKSKIEPAMKMAHATHANSVLLYNELKRIHKKVFYVPNGVDSNLFYPYTPLLENEEMVFGHVGKKSPMKGQIDYIEPAVNLSGVQYFSHYNNYKTRLSHTRMVDVHQNYDVFICASKEDGTPCPALEAAACGRPIISNKIGNMPELIENYKTGILLDKKDVDLYIDAIKWCKDNPDKVVEMGKNIREKIQQEWTWELMAKNYLYMFDSILKIKREPELYENPAKYHI